MTRPGWSTECNAAPGNLTATRVTAGTVDVGARPEHCSKPVRGARAVANVGTGSSTRARTSAPKGHHLLDDTNRPCTRVQEPPRSRWTVAQRAQSRLALIGLVSVAGRRHDVHVGLDLLEFGETAGPPQAADATLLVTAFLEGTRFRRVR